MAKNATAAAAEGEQQAAKERAYITSQDTWDKSGSPEFGGQADILQIGIGEVAGPFEYQGHQAMQMEGGKTVTVHLGVGPDNETMRLPIAASFLRAVDQADLFRGDKFLIRRGEDAKKKAGLGKGQMMHIFAIKVVSQVERPKKEGVPF